MSDLKLSFLIWAGIILVLVLLLLLQAHMQGQTAATKTAVMVCEGKCLKAITLSDHARLEAPVKADGTADYSKGRITGTLVTVDHSLEKIELKPNE